MQWLSLIITAASAPHADESAMDNSSPLPFCLFIQDHTHTYPLHPKVQMHCEIETPLFALAECDEKCTDNKLQLKLIK